jgi:hypothetical protein
MFVKVPYLTKCQQRKKNEEYDDEPYEHSPGKPSSDTHTIKYGKLHWKQQQQKHKPLIV